MARLLGTWPDGSPEWHEARRWRVGGSEVGAICGWSKYATRDQVMADKLHPRPRETPAMRRGHYVEPAVLAYLSTELGVTIDAEASAATYTADEDERLAYNPDGITVDWGLLEAKSTSDRNTDDGWGRARTAIVPIGYQAQAQWGMGILGIDECWLGVLAGAHNSRPDLHFALYRIPFNPRAYTYMTTQAHRFLDELERARKDHHEDPTADR